MLFLLKIPKATTNSRFTITILLAAPTTLGSDLPFNEPVLDLVPGTTMTVEGQIATLNRTFNLERKGFIVVIDNIALNILMKTPC